VNAIHALSQLSYGPDRWESVRWEPINLPTRKPGP